MPAYACDNNKSRWGQKIFSVPICSPDELNKEKPSECVIVVTATESCGIMAELFTSREKYYFEIANINQLDSYLTFVNHREEFLAVYNRLEDEKSKRNYAGILSGCMAGNINFPMFYSQNPYWDNDVVGRLNDNDVVVMGGAYDGKHIDRALASNSTVTVHAFEPNENVFDNLKSKYEDNPNVIIHNYALYDKETTLTFDSSSNLGAKVISAQNRGGGYAPRVTLHTINAINLDQALNYEKIDLIAMDIEGSEPYALEGAKNIIKRYHPKLTICAYHQYEHYFQLPLWIVKTDSSYKLHFRTHTIRDWDSVIYAV